MRHILVTRDKTSEVSFNRIITNILLNKVFLNFLIVGNNEIGSLISKTFISLFSSFR